MKVIMRQWSELSIRGDEELVYISFCLVLAWTWLCLFRDVWRGENNAWCLQLLAGWRDIRLSKIM